MWGWLLSIERSKKKLCVWSPCLRQKQDLKIKIWKVETNSTFSVGFDHNGSNLYRSRSILAFVWKYIRKVAELKSEDESDYWCNNVAKTGLFSGTNLPWSFSQKNRIVFCWVCSHFRNVNVWISCLGICANYRYVTKFKTVIDLSLLRTRHQHLDREWHVRDVRSTSSFSLFRILPFMYRHRQQKMEIEMENHSAFLHRLSSLPVVETATAQLASAYTWVGLKRQKLLRMKT